MKVAVVSIMKNESKHIARWAESCKDADYRYLLDTGSSDDSVELAESFGVTVLSAEINPWHFAKARNHLLDLLPDDIDWIVNLDVDEVFGPNWRALLEAVPNDGSVNRPRYNYTWNWDEFIYNSDGSVDVQGTVERGKRGLQYKGDKITRRLSHRWVNAVHEVNITQPGFQELQGFCELEIFHFADNTKSRGSYLPLLLQDVADNPHNDRNMFYAGRECMFHGMKDKSIELLKEHVRMPESTWPPERAFSMRYIAAQSPDEREHWLLRGAAEYPYGREMWGELAQHYHNIGDWESCYWAAQRGLGITHRGDLYLTESVYWGWFLHDHMALSAYRTGRYQIALEQGYKALEHAPDDKRLKDNLFFYKNAVSKADVVIPTKDYYTGLSHVVARLLEDPKVDNIFVICDGEDSFITNGVVLSNKVQKILTTGPFNIHRAWNIGIDLSRTGNHVMFLNDDVQIASDTISKLVEELDRNPDIGLICPAYSNNQTYDLETTVTCRGRYDGTGGMAGFAMMLVSDMKTWRFDESMALWYGEDDLVNHVVATNRKCVITMATRCHHEHSKTLDKLPPDVLSNQVQLDRQHYEGKQAR